MDPEELECERLLQAGDPEAIPRLMKRYQRPLFSFLRHQVGDSGAAEDLLQELLIRVWGSRERFQARQRLAAWLFTIARRLSIDHLEKSSRRRHESIDAEPDGKAPLKDVLRDPGETPERALEGAALRRRLEEAIAALPDEQREVFLLRQYGEMGFVEIAAMTGCPLGTALARMRYAVLKLRKCLGETYA